MNGLQIQPNDPPRTDEIEISIFGPGFGECIVVHVGGGEWITIDSCRDLTNGGDNAALSYLERINVDPSSAIKLIVVSHWHDDHIKGVSEIIAEAASAKIAITSAFEHREFHTAISPWLNDLSAHGGKGVRELKKLGPRLRNRRWTLASAEKILLERKAPFRCEVRSLSPSDASVLACVARLRALPPDSWAGKIPLIEDNHTSAALSVCIEDRRILLGADLQKLAAREHGWLAVVDAHVESGREKYHVLKIAHHGSHNGDTKEIWETLVVDDAHSIATPFIWGKHKLPNPSDIQRINSRTKNAWITAHPKGKSFQPSDRSILRTMSQQARRLEEIPRGFGQVRLRGKIGEPASEWGVELFGPAHHLSKS